MLARDTAADGQFFYAVKSTMIYCRPSCPSRRPARQNVRFFPTASAAEQAGFRACKRCRPDLATPRPDPQADLIARAADYLARHATERTRLADLARVTGVGRLTLLRAFRRVLGVSPGEFARAQRVAHFKDALRPAASRRYHYVFRESRRCVRQQTQARRQAHHRRHLRIRLRLLQPPLRVQRRLPRNDSAHAARRRRRPPSSATPRRAVRWAGCWPPPPTPESAPSHSAATTPNSLADLRQRFNQAQLVPAKGNTGWLADALAFVLSQTTEHPLAATFPLDVRATAFQQRVWRALQQVPRGQTRSYSALARSLGKPTAARAVAAACAANPVALAVPCHRAIGADGSLTGYRWGLQRKQKLLAAEARTAQHPVH